jgi:hypothetical protein
MVSPLVGSRSHFSDAYEQSDGVALGAGLTPAEKIGGRSPTDAGSRATEN